ncbi:MAG: hypothetical protein GX927_07610 [Lentisphaerae bacterium]|jgi:hypothetical protein|nr:hypothetical protein [Lentisphaerota bacterium]
MKAVNMIVLSALIATAAAQDSDCDGIPTGAWTEASILPANTIPDGNLTKYKSEWILLKSEITGQIPKINRTEAAIGLTEDRKFLLVAMRCFEESMDKLAEKSQFSDREEIFQDDHIEIHLNTPSKNWFLVAVNPAGAIWDESRDLAIIKRDSLPVLWNPGTAAHVSKFADRWEIEVAIPCKDFGRLGPSEKHPWGINLSRTRQVSGKAESFALVPQAGAYPDFLPAKWMRLWKKPWDADGNLINSYGFIVVPQRENQKSYTVRRAKGKVAIDNGWDSPDWKHIEAVTLTAALLRPGGQRTHSPDTQVKLQYDDNFLYGLFQVKDRYVRAVARQNQEQVCLDSCVEFYVRPRGSLRYFNFEFNCGGKMLLYEIEDILTQKFEPIPEEELASIKRFHTLPEIVDPEIESPVTWRLGFQIPLEFFARRANLAGSPTGQEWTGNFYKCADHTSHPHWLAWKSVQDFHCPDEFGILIFE